MRTGHRDYWIFVTMVNRVRVYALGHLLFKRAPDGEESIFDDEIVERVRTRGRVRSRTGRRQRHVDGELPIVALRYRAFVEGGPASTVKEKLVPSTWLEQQSRRLDCGPYLSGAMEAKALLERLPVRCVELRDLTRGYDGGIYKPPVRAELRVGP